MSIVDFIKLFVPSGSKVRIDSVEIDEDTMKVESTVRYPIDLSKVNIKISR